MTAAVAGAARGGVVRSGAVTQAERDTLAAKIAAASKPAEPQPRATVAARGGRGGVRGGLVPSTAGQASSPKPGPSQPRPTTPSRQPAPAAKPAGRMPFGGGGGGGAVVVNSAAGVVLAALVWGWVVLPLVTGGPAKVKAVLRAKFVNRGPGGEWLP